MRPNTVSLHIILFESAQVYVMLYIVYYCICLFDATCMTISVVAWSPKNKIFFFNVCHTLVNKYIFFQN